MGVCTACWLRGALLLSFWGAGDKCQQSSEVLKLEGIHLQNLGFPLMKQRKEALDSGPNLDTNVPAPHYSPRSGLSQSERWVSVPVAGGVPAAIYQGLNAACFCKRILIPLFVFR